MPSTLDPLAGLTVLQRGWLSSNNILIHAAEGEAGAVLVDSSHVNHAEQTVALVRHALAGGRLDRIVNTHLHSDHCGGNATLQRAFGVPGSVPPGHADAVREWDESSLTYAASGQRCERFEIAGTHDPGDDFTAGGRRWQVLEAPGHDPHSVLLFDPTHGVLISADALWERGFGVVFPELDGDEAFDDVARALDLIESLDARWALPGHGAPFSDLVGALARARQRLAAFVADPRRHDRHAAKVMIKYHLLEVQSCTWPALLAWLGTSVLCTNIWHRLGEPGGSLAAFAEQLVIELVASGALQRRGKLVLNA
jgi:glyoxylase-like metal-dependent hydrolase (beta-lactamase superfamily II)